MTSLPAKGNRVVMEKRHLGLLLRIGATTGVAGAALSATPQIQSGPDRTRKRIPPGATTAARPTPWGIRAAKQINKTNVTSA